MKDNCDFIEITTVGSNFEVLKSSLESLVKKFKQTYPDEDGDTYEAVFTLTKIRSEKDPA